MSASVIAFPPLRDRVVLLHCSAGSGRSWRPLAEALGDHYEVAAPDIASYGRNADGNEQAASDKPSILGPLVAELEARPGSLHLVGHSFGGVLALELAGILGARVASLTLIEPVAFHLLRDGDFADRQLFREITGLAACLHAALEQGAAVRGMAAFIDYWNGKGAWAALEDGPRRQLAAQAAVVARDFRVIFAEPPAQERYRRVVAPCQLLYGEHSPRPTRRIVEILAQVLPWAAARRVAGAGHMLPLTHRTEVQSAVAEQLKAFGRAAPPADRSLAAAS